jgi:hypothetical protein
MSRCDPGETAAPPSGGRGNSPALQWRIEMAKLSSHGREVGTVYFTTSAKRYMSDGAILKNGGFGWKLHAKLKPGVVPSDAFKKQADHQKKVLADNPEVAAYRRELHDLCGVSKRWKLHAAVSLMPDDPDGVWSEACDGYGDNVSADIDEIVKLCRLYKAIPIPRQACTEPAA